MSYVEEYRQIIGSQMLDAIIEERGDLWRFIRGRTEHFFVASTWKTFYRT